MYVKSTICFLLAILLLNLPIQAKGNELLSAHKKLFVFEEPNAFNVRFFQGFGYRHVGWDLDAAFQFRKYFSVGIGIAAHYNKTVFYSASDKHNLNLWSFPVFAYTNIFVLNRTNGSLYLHAKIGRSFGIKTENVTPDKSFNAVVVDAGIGFQSNTGRRPIYFELGQYYTTAKGTLASSYNSIIQYSDMEVFNITGRIGFRF